MIKRLISYWNHLWEIRDYLEGLSLPIRCYLYCSLEVVRKMANCQFQTLKFPKEIVNIDPTARSKAVTWKSYRQRILSDRPGPPPKWQWVWVSVCSKIPFVLFPLASYHSTPFWSPNYARQCKILAMDWSMTGQCRMLAVTDCNALQGRFCLRKLPRAPQLLSSTSSWARERSCVTSKWWGSWPTRW